MGLPRRLQTQSLSPTPLKASLTDGEAWTGRSLAGLAFVETASWDVAAKQIESGLRDALREREPSIK